MIEKYEEKPLKEFIILYYEDLMKAAVDREDYETAAKYKKWIDNLKKSGEK
jgi:protein-arginine kinase activator protein McsA